MEDFPLREFSHVSFFVVHKTYNRKQILAGVDDKFLRTTTVSYLKLLTAAQPKDWILLYWDVLSCSSSSAQMFQNCVQSD